MNITQLAVGSGLNTATFSNMDELKFFVYVGRGGGGERRKEYRKRQKPYKETTFNTIKEISRAESGPP